MFGRLQTALRSSRIRRLLGQIEPDIRKVLTLRDEFAAKTDDELKSIAGRLGEDYETSRHDRRRLHRGLALGCEGVRRGLGLDVRDEQLAGALLLDAGHVVEMRTGEGKTLMAAVAAVPTAVGGGGVHVITTNDYLASRDAEWMGPVYRHLGLTVGVVPTTGTLLEKRRAYAADVTYASHSDIGFDHLRDHMRLRSIDWVQRGMPFAIVDEVDSILIDEARTPLIIGAVGEEPSPLFAKVSPLVETLSPERDVTVDARSFSATLTDHGYDTLHPRLERAGVLDEGTLFEEANADLNHVVQRCLVARFVYRRDEHYTIDEHERIVILDPYTGRMMPTRRWGDGLHQAIEARERVSIRRDQPARASCSYRSLFQLYDRLAGMTGTATGIESEFRDIYGLEVVTLPTHRPVVREDHEDAVFLLEEEKLSALLEVARERHSRGQPVLVGTASERSAMKVAAALEAAGMPARLLLARDHEREASIVAEAGRLGAVTVATQLAGRGTDIRLGGGEPEEAKRVVAAGGLAVLGFERHRARRIDEQLRGRAGRQGDPGSSRFFVSLEDALPLKYREEAARSAREMTGRPRSEWETRAAKVIADSQSSAESDDETIRVAARELDAIVDRQREHFYDVRDRLLLGRAERGDEVVLRGMESIEKRVRIPITRLFTIAEEKADASAHQNSDSDPVAIRMRSGLDELFGVRLDLSEFEGERDAVMARLCRRAAEALRRQRRRLRSLTERVMSEQVDMAFREGSDGALERLEAAFGEVAPMLPPPPFDAMPRAELPALLRGAVMRHLRERMTTEAPRRLLRCFRLLYVRALDEAWADHLADVMALRDGIYWRGLGRQDPVLVFEKEAHAGYLEAHRQAELRALRELLATPPLDAERLRALEATIRDASRRAQPPASALKR